MRLERMDHQLVVANLADRPGRAGAAAAGIALGVVLILVTVGLAHGLLLSSGERDSRVRAEVLFQPAGSFAQGLTARPLTLPVGYAAAIAELPGVEATTPVGRYLRSGAGGIGFELIEGVSFVSGAGERSYPEITGLAVVAGRAPQADDEVIVDREHARTRGVGVGSRFDLLGRRFTVVGIYQPEVGPRIKMPLEAMQRLLGGGDKCSSILVKITGGTSPERVAGRIDRTFPGHQVILTRDIPGFYQQALPSLTVFLRVVVGVAMVVSGLVALLAMYTAVSERRREIGILKSLGASPIQVLGVIEREALLLALLGIGGGELLAVVVAVGIRHGTALVVVLEPWWLVVAGTVALVATGLGALYPAVRAASQDAVEALAHE